MKDELLKGAICAWGDFIGVFDTDEEVKAILSAREL